MQFRNEPDPPPGASWAAVDGGRLDRPVLERTAFGRRHVIRKRRIAGVVAAGLLFLGLAPPVRGQGYTLWNFPSATRAVGAGDVNGDGFADIFAAGGNVATVFSGATGGTIHTIVLPFLVTSLSTAGDIDGDGVGDLVVGAGSIGGFPVSGQVAVFSGSSGAVLHTFTGSGPSDGLGVSVADAGDVDADGIPDVLAGATAQTYARVFSGATGAILHTLSGVPGDGFGLSVAGAGDVNGDGNGDLFIGIPLEGGIGATGKARVYSGATGAVIHEFLGMLGAAKFG
jgi:hypothetical protein